MITKIKFSTRVISVAILAAILGHVLLYGTVAFTSGQSPSTISTVWAVSAMAILIVMLAIVLTRGQWPQIGTGDERSR